MNKKVLTISIAAYNVERYLEQCLQSLCETDALEKLEVFVIDDGGKDNSIKIAERYENDYPGIFYAIHKENGGYGSTVNWAIKNAKGKYFKLLDGDDWFNSQGLSGLLRYMENANDDIIFTDILHYYGKHETIKFIERNADSFNAFANSDLIEIWGIAFKTVILKRMDFSLPEHIFYTDNLLGFIPFLRAESFQVVPEVVYCYRHGRDGQSTSFEQKVRHIKDMEIVGQIMCTVYSEQVNENHRNYYWLKRKLAMLYKMLIWAMILRKDTEVSKDLRALDKKIKDAVPDVFYEIERSGIRGKYIKIMRKMDYRGIWAMRLFYRELQVFHKYIR